MSSHNSEGEFDPAAKERELVAQSTEWDTSRVVAAAREDIPTIDVEPWFVSNDDRELQVAARQLRFALEEVGFHQLIGHGVAPDLLDSILDETRRFHALPLETKQTIVLDRADHHVGGVGYMPVGARKLPARRHGNPNEAFLVKSDIGVSFDDNLWPDERTLPGFRATVERYANAMESLARRLLRLYEAALELDYGYFDEAFDDPFWRLRMTHYPSNPVGDDLGEVGIPPHVDTTFMTLLLPDSPGLVIYSQTRREWILAPVVPGAFVVNAGELLRQWSNDRVLSTRHFANNTSATSRYSVPFFFNARADYPMTCLPSCCGPGNPPRYPTISYLKSQGVVQGE